MISTTVLAAQAAGGGSAAPILMMVAIFAIMYFFMIRPQQKKQKAIRNFQNALQEGARVVTSGGVYGKAHQYRKQHGGARGGSWRGCYR